MDTGKVVLVTGSGRGIGAATASLFAEHGYAVCLNYKSNAAAAGEIKDAIVSRGGRCIAVQADVAVETEIVRLFETIDQELGTLSVLVNNAGVLQRQQRLVEMNAERVTRTLTSNVVGYFICAREAVKRMSSKNGGAGGAIVNVSSIAARTGSPNEYVDYAAAKGAIDTMTTGLAIEVADEGVRVNGVRPGLIYTDMHADGGEPGRVDRLKSRIPMQRGGSPEEIAAAIYWLASDAASFVTGSFIDVAGGLR